MENRRPVAIELQYDVLLPGLTLVPSFQFLNPHGICLFASANPDRVDRPRPTGRYTSTRWIPSNLLKEGKIYVSAVITSVDPHVVHVAADKAVGFEVKSPGLLEPDRLGDGGEYPGLIRPQLAWTSDAGALPDELTAAGCGLKASLR